jgi:aminoglycoside phosphotransferase (APT) family kinase protein
MLTPPSVRHCVSVSATITAMQLLASGRAADVYDQGDGTVLRRYKTDHDTALEARVMKWLHGLGYPVPKVHSAGGRDIVMQKIDGVTMIEDLGRRPWRLVSHARTLAELQGGLNILEAPDWLPERPGVPPGRSTVHLDLHPYNVMITAAGPVVIDWTNVTRSVPEFDAAMTYIVVSSAELKGHGFERLGRTAFIECFRLWRGRAAIGSKLIEAARYRAADPNVTPKERRRLENLLLSHSRRLRRHVK